MAGTPLQSLRDYGQSPWVDALSRGLVRGGELERLIREHGIRGLSSELSTLLREIEGGVEYDEEARALVRSGQHSPDAIVGTLAVTDIQRACDLLLPVWDETAGGDGHASLEIDPRLAHRPERMREQAKLLWGLVDRPNFLVGIPATPAGLAAIEDSIAAGISVNATLIFSLARYDDVVRAYVRGVERLVEAGGDPASVTSVAGLHVSPIDAEVERLGIATAKLAYQRYKQAFTCRSWQPLAARGARAQHCRWASTATHGGAYCDVVYVEELIGADTVTTLTPSMISAFEEQGVVADRLERGVAEAQALFEDVRSAGLNLDDVWQTLEREGVQKLVRSYEQLLACIEAKYLAGHR
jgi:transaldolase